MPKYTIPDLFVPGFNEIASLNDEKLEAILLAIESLKIGDGPEFLSSVLKEAKILNGIDVYEISITIFSIINLIFDDEIDDVESLLDDLILSYKDHATGRKKLQLDKLKINLFSLLSNRSKLNLTIKALKLGVEFEKTFSKSRIFTDIRVVFGPDIKNDKQSALLIHNLQLEYKKNGSDKKLFMTMDSDDLRNLKIQIERALEKETSLRATNNISFIDINL
ncbi:hypothetical protein LX99_04559 [Mucilaginibacter oryzae]|uniref:Uncharacterized protein n=1 Tax=Mucilaginibacter oryzae TaxID=468058 RepID=A0A316H1A6_9SPHI|nr:hypothetical protein [Mucilaginibacter oryzae]PWK70851.1 hypothetical protein LX99_04559 [Mucilaginibacter oryzae]